MSPTQTKVTALCGNGFLETTIVLLCSVTWDLLFGVTGDVLLVSGCPEASSRLYGWMERNSEGALAGVLL